MSEFMMPERFETLKTVLAGRTRWMTVCMENTFHPHNASALILTSLTDTASRKTYELELMLAREDNYWVVYSIENAVELFEQAMDGKD